jgi:hypothetical protein
MIGGRAIKKCSLSQWAYGMTFFLYLVALERGGRIPETKDGLRQTFADSK